VGEQARASRPAGHQQQRHRVQRLALAYDEIVEGSDAPMLAAVVGCDRTH